MSARELGSGCGEGGTLESMGLMETDAFPPAERFESGEPLESREPSEPPQSDEDGVDLTLLRWMLSLTPAGRLEVLQQHVDAVEAIRGAS